MFEPVCHKPIYEEVVEVIVKRIHSGNLAVGQKLPPERELADELGVSRGSLREALRVLESTGYIRSAVGGGNYVNQVEVKHVLSPFAAMLAQDSQLTADIIEVRRHLETHMATLAAKNADKADLARIFATIVNMQAEIAAGGNGIQGDNAFHLEIAKASHNRAFAVIVELCFELLSESRRATLNIPGQPEKTVEDHTAIFEAIRDRDEDRAAREMSAHLLKAHENIVRRPDRDGA